MDFNTTIGLDPGLTTTGLAFVHDDCGLYFGQFSSSTKDDLPKRFDDTTAWIRHQIEEGLQRGFIARLARVEQLHGGYRAGDRARVKNFMDLIHLAELIGAIINELTRIGLPVQLVEPSPMRIAGRPVRRDVKKKIAKAIVAARYHEKIPEHAADAILLAAPATTTEIADGWAVVRGQP